MTDPLSTRCERAGPDEQRRFLIELYPLAHPKPEWGIDAINTWHDHSRTFRALLAIGTNPPFLAAAMMMKPEGAGMSLTGPMWAAQTWQATVNLDGDESTAEASTPALALCAAVSRSVGL